VDYSPTPSTVRAAVIPNTNARSGAMHTASVRIIARDLAADAIRRTLAEADRSRIADYRAAEEACIERSIAAQTAERRT
jgi:hypothetical protein